jgi:hypothetical protein
VLLLAAYAARTLLRNADWWNDERLFLSALAVCPTSAKVQQNCGVLMRRYGRMDDALAHFRCAWRWAGGAEHYTLGMMRARHGHSCLLSTVAERRLLLPPLAPRHRAFPAAGARRSWSPPTVSPPTGLG